MTSIKLKNYLVCTPHLLCRYTICYEFDGQTKLLHLPEASNETLGLNDSKRSPCFGCTDSCFFVSFTTCSFSDLAQPKQRTSLLAPGGMGRVNQQNGQGQTKSSIFQMNQWNLWEMNQSLPMLDPKAPPTKRIGPSWGFWAVLTTNLPSSGFFVTYGLLLWKGLSKSTETYETLQAMLLPEWPSSTISKLSFTCGAAQKGPLEELTNEQHATNHKIKKKDPSNGIFPLLNVPFTFQTSLMLRWATTMPLCTAASISFQDRWSIRRFLIVTWRQSISPATYWDRSKVHQRKNTLYQ